MVPSLIVLAAAVEPTTALVFSQLVLSFCIPFALVPLILVSRDARVMREQVNRHLVTAIASLVAALIIGLNLYLIYSTLV
jgi:manganese transport protein